MIGKIKDLVVVAFLSIVILCMTFTGIQIPYLSAALGVLFVLLAPGYALSSALFTHSGNDRAETLLISLGVSMAVSISGGYLLNLTPWGLQAASWATLLSIITLGATAVAILRRRGSPLPTQTSLRLSLSQSMMLIGTVILICSAISISRSGAATQSYPAFTQLWAIPAAGSQPNKVQLGIQNYENNAQTYRLLIVIAGRTAFEWSKIDLAPGEIWTATALLKTQPTTTQPMFAKLYRSDAPNSVYRQVMINSGVTVPAQ